jgi:hypothetical protein
MKNQDEYHDMAKEETLNKFYYVLMKVFNGDADAMLGELEHRSAEVEDYETAAAMRDIRKRI